jgi:hypothetical protein
LVARCCGRMEPTVRSLGQIRNNDGHGSKRHFCLPGSPISKPPNGPLPLEIQLPGTEFLEAETGGQKSALETADVHRDRKSSNDTGQIPAETASLESPTKCAVWEDWMVEMVWFELAALHAVLSNRVSATRLDRVISLSLRAACGSVPRPERAPSAAEDAAPSRHRSFSPNESAGRPSVMSSTAATAPSFASCFKGAEDLNRWTVANEWAVAYRKYSRGTRR